MKINQAKMDSFINSFNNTIFPTIKGDDGNGIEKFKRIVEHKREVVNKRNEKKRNI